MSVHRPHLPNIEPCPYLPVVDSPVTYHAVRQLGNERGPVFYETALRYASSLWRQGLPGRTLLLANRALGADLRGDEPILRTHPLPYRAVAWILKHRPASGFMGNPRRHYQHLATRMTPPRKEQRMWRAWACWYLSTLVLPCEDYPADERQIACEGVKEPAFEVIAAALEAVGIQGESTVWLEAIREVHELGQ